MTYSRTAHELLASDSRVVLPRVGGGVGEGGRAIHVSRLTRRDFLPVENAARNATAATHAPDAWMGCADGGGL